MDLKETDILGPAIGGHWYYRAKSRAMLKLAGALAPRVVLDIGAGSAFFSRHLLRHTAAASACCVDISYDADSDASEAGKPIHFRRAVGPSSADLVLLMDVLEHVDDDVALLKEYADKVPSGSTFLISVPAFQCLWSEHDEFLEHRRRYTLAGLEAVVEQAGLEVDKGCYFFAAVLPLAAGLRLVQKIRGKISGKARAPRSQLARHHPVVNALLAWVCKLELSWMHFNRLGGLSVFCLARKR